MKNRKAVADRRIPYTLAPEHTPIELVPAEILERGPDPIPLAQVLELEARLSRARKGAA